MNDSNDSKPAAQAVVCECGHSINEHDDISACRHHDGRLFCSCEKLPGDIRAAALVSRVSDLERFIQKATRRFDETGERTMADEARNLLGKGN